MERSHKLLLVDDSPVALMMVQMLLRGGGYQLREAHDGAQALALVQDERPDLIVMDFAMPKLDGLSALRALKAEQATSNIPVIMLTSEGSADEIERCFQAGCDAYVTKPVHAATLKSKIEALLGAGPHPA
jgi:CheY-like chemotaxis protein